MKNKVKEKSEMIISGSETETLQLARDFSRRLQPGQRVALRGEIGSGKTCFAKGVISELTQTDVHEITSPTFTLMEEYGGAVKIYHLDLYRIEREEDCQALPWDEIFGNDVITLVEWPEHLKSLLPNCHFEVQFDKAGPLTRRVKILNKEMP